MLSIEELNNFKNRNDFVNLLKKKLPKKRFEKIIIFSNLFLGNFFFRRLTKSFRFLKLFNSSIDNIFLKKVSHLNLHHLFQMPVQKDLNYLVEVNLRFVHWTLIVLSSNLELY